MLNKGKLLVKDIEGMGYEAYIVGGTPRDMLLEKPTHDVDIATNCPMKVLREKFITYDVGHAGDFGVVIVRYNNEVFDVAQFRLDGKYSDGRHPDKVQRARTIEEDVKRRDFTINGLVLRGNGEIVDYVGGLEDLRNKLVRAIGDPKERFQEDHLRMIRAARFAARTDFRIESQTRRAIMRLAHLIHGVSPERIRMEIIKSAQGNGKEFARFIRLLDDLQILSKILPEVHSMKYYRHQIPHHPEGITVLDHSLACVEMFEEGTPFIKIAALLHDVGKPLSFSEDDGLPHYYRHESVGVSVVEELSKRLTFSNEELEALKFVVKNHMKFHKLLEMKPSKIAKLVFHEYFQVLKEVAWADEFCRGEKFAHYGEFDQKLERANEIIEKWKHRIPQGSRKKLVNGNHVMKITGMKPGPELGRIINTVEEYLMDNGVNPDSEEANEIILEVYHAECGADQR